MEPKKVTTAAAAAVATTATTTTIHNGTKQNQVVLLWCDDDDDFDLCVVKTKPNKKKPMVRVNRFFFATVEISIVLMLFFFVPQPFTI